MKYEDIVLKKFSFTKIEISSHLEEVIWNLDFPDTGKKEGEVRYKIKGVEPLVRNSLRNEIITKLGLYKEKDLVDYIDKFEFDINKMQKGEWVPMHNEISQKSPFEVILWLTKTDTYEGREFIMKEGDNEKRVQPTNGMVCFLDTTAPNVYHGVSKLITDTEIITITGGLGRKNEYT